MHPRKLAVSLLPQPRQR